MTHSQTRTCQRPLKPTFPRKSGIRKSPSEQPVSSAEFLRIKGPVSGGIERGAIRYTRFNQRLDRPCLASKWAGWRRRSGCAYPNNCQPPCRALIVLPSWMNGSSELENTDYTSSGYYLVTISVGTKSRNSTTFMVASERISKVDTLDASTGRKRQC